MIFAEKVKYVRGELYLTQKQLAEKLGVSFATVNRWESKGVEPTFLVKKKFEDFCKQNNILFNDENASGDK
jgi:transcriptional regulator with XRE-family HTH domain